MGIKDVVGRHWRTPYKKLTSIDEKEARPRSRWVTRMNGKLKGLRLSNCRKLNWKAFSVSVIPKTRTAMNIDDMLSPSIIFCGQWGLPMLSHHFSANRRTSNATSLPRRNWGCPVPDIA
ncbi:hypothetical protein NMG60_11032326 [Bertholletia excelsa]